jgi:hypothetical protein
MRIAGGPHLRVIYALTYLDKQSADLLSLQHSAPPLSGLLRRMQGERYGLQTVFARVSLPVYVLRLEVRSR